MCKIRKVSILDMFDMAAVSFLIGQGIGRWGNFVNQEAYGAFTNSTFWGMESTRTISEMGKGLVHPCFLYESLWCIGGFLLLNHLSKSRKFKGQMLLSYGVWYGFGRAFIELLRTDSLMIGSLKVSCVLSFLICISCGIVLAVMFKRIKEKSNDVVYESVFADNEETDVEEALNDKDN